MSKYSFDRMLPDQFEAMAKALLEKTRRPAGGLIQFGDGPDGGREATWTEPAASSSITNRRSRRPGRKWLFQVKYHDIGLRGWQGARDALLDELPRELNKLTGTAPARCDVYVLITNVPLTGAKAVGTRDRIEHIASKYRRKIRVLEVWDAADLSAMLDANQDVRDAYLDTLLPGDILARLMRQITAPGDRLHATLRAYLRHVYTREQDVRAEEAGDEPGLRLQDVFIDIDLKLIPEPATAAQDMYDSIPRAALRSHRKGSPSYPFTTDGTSASTALLLLDHPAHFLLGGPGYGKSTLTQFLVFYHAARVISPQSLPPITAKLKLPPGVTPALLDASCVPRIPFRIELRRYALWLSEHDTDDTPGHLARYIADNLINANASSALDMDDVFAICATNPILLVLDGLDEVPNPAVRRHLLRHAEIFITRVRAESSDLSVILSSRPRGYAGEFNAFAPLTWELRELTPKDLQTYCDTWLAHRLPDADDRAEARVRLHRGLESEAVRHLAATLLQATVMLAIVRRKIDIPHERHALYAKYVEVTFEREKLKSHVVRERATELLRLHERVGYELHKRMEDSEAKALDADGFKSLVLDVLHEYSTMPLAPSLSAVADSIINASKDRLCMLAGTGVHQTDMDFVVQTYREYFAAEYLANHSRADPDKVFGLLVARGAYWANVLQFYVARAQPNQQLRWILRAGGDSTTPTCLDDLLARVRTRRALLPLLPELGRQQRGDFRLCLTTIFEPGLRWTFASAQTYGGLLRDVRGGSAADLIRGALEPLKTDDPARAVADIKLLCDVSSGNADAEAQLRTTLLAVANESFGDVVCSEILSHNIPIDLATLPFETLTKGNAIRRHNNPAPSKRFISAQSLEGVCALAFMGVYVTPLASPYKIDTMLAALFPLDSARFEVRHYGGFTAPYLSRGNDDVKALKDWLQALPESRGPVARYFAALCKSVVDSMDSEAYSAAVEAFAALHGSGRRDWDPEAVLGPPPSSFASTDDWVRFRAEVQRQATESATWFHEAFADRAGRTGLLLTAFHPSCWADLGSACRISAQDLSALLAGRVFAILSMPTKSIGAVSRFNYLFHSESARDIDWVSLLRVAGAVTRTQRVDRVPLLPFHLTGVSFADVDEELVRRVQEEAEDWADLPSGWAQIYIRLCVECPGRDTNRLLAVFDSCRFMSLPELNVPDGEKLNAVASDLVARLVVDGRPSGLKLAATLATGYGLHDGVRRALHEALIVSLFSDDVDDRSKWHYLRLYLSGRVGVGRLAEVLRSPNTARLLQAMPWLVEELADFIDKQSPDALSSLKSTLEEIVLKRQAFPWQVASKALQGLLRLDSAPSSSPLLDAGWKSEPLSGAGG